MYVYMYRTHTHITADEEHLVTTGKKLQKRKDIYTLHQKLV